MNCADVEILICDYLDRSISAGERVELERHLAGCANCAELAQDAAAAVQFIERAETVEPPPELLTRILFDAPWQKRKAGWFSTVFNSVLQPRFAMGMALTILSFAMVGRNFRQLQPSDLAPMNVWAGIEDRAYRVWARTQKFYDNLKIVYQIQTTLREWQQDQEAQPASESDAPRSAPAANPPGKP